MAAGTAAATEHIAVAESEQVPEGGRYVVDVRGTVVGLFRVGGAVHAYHNVCPHQGGPVCQGRIFPAVVEKLDDLKRSGGPMFDEHDLRIVCPWHGFEFRIATGAHPGKSDIRLRRFDVVERDGVIHVAL
jgi:nitrite reductase/ring-hydroxylating ferredoxin subunit